MNECCQNKSKFAKHIFLSESKASVRWTAVFSRLSFPSGPNNFQFHFYTQHQLRFSFFAGVNFKRHYPHKFSHWQKRDCCKVDGGIRCCVDSFCHRALQARRYPSKSSRVKRFSVTEPTTKFWNSDRRDSLAFLHRNVASIDQEYQLQWPSDIFS